MGETDDLDKIIGEDVVVPPSEGTPEPLDEEIAKKKKHAENLDKAIREGTEILRQVRKAAKGTKPEEEELPKIDLEDPGAKSWDRHITEKVRPVIDEAEREKEEIFDFAFQDFIKDKPVLINNPDRRKAFLEKYEKLKSSTGRTKEGVTRDLNSAFGAEFHNELVSRAVERRVESAMADALFADPAVSRGTSTSEQNEKEKTVVLSADDKAILAKWGMSPEEYAELKKKY